MQRSYFQPLYLTGCVQERLRLGIAVCVQHSDACICCETNASISRVPWRLSASEIHVFWRVRTHGVRRECFPRALLSAQWPPSLSGVQPTPAGEEEASITHTTRTYARRLRFTRTRLSSRLPPLNFTIRVLQRALRWPPDQRPSSIPGIGARAHIDPFGPRRVRGIAHVIRRAAIAPFSFDGPSPSLTLSVVQSG